MPDAGRIHVDHVHIWQLPNHQDIREGTAYSIQTCSGCGESKPYNIAGDYPDIPFNMGETPVSADKSDVAFNPARRGPGRPRAEQPADPPTKELDEDHGKVASETREQTGAMGDKRRQCTNGCGRISWSDGLCATCYRDRYEALAASILVVNGDAKNTNEEPTLAPDASKHPGYVDPWVTGRGARPARTPSGRGILPHGGGFLRGRSNDD